MLNWNQKQSLVKAMLTVTIPVIRSNMILIPISAFVFLAAIRRVVEEIEACIVSSSDILDAELQSL